MDQRRLSPIEFRTAGTQQNPGSGLSVQFALDPESDGNFDPSPGRNHPRCEDMRGPHRLTDSGLEPTVLDSPVLQAIRPYDRPCPRTVWNTFPREVHFGPTIPVAGSGEQEKKNSCALNSGSRIGDHGAFMAVGTFQRRRTFRASQQSIIPILCTETKPPSRGWRRREGPCLLDAQRLFLLW
jgi:hypothetical protein